MSDSGTKKSQGEQDPEKPVKRKKKMSKKKKLATALLILLALLVIIAGAVYAVGHHYYSKTNYMTDEEVAEQLAAQRAAQEEAEAEEEEEIDPELQAIQANLEQFASTEPITSDGNVYNVVLVGLDTTTEDFIGNSDSMILISINYRLEQISMISLMRDTYVDIPGVGYRKLNASYPNGAGPLLCETITENYKVQVDRYVTVDFGNMIDIIDAIGTIEITFTEKEAENANKSIRQQCRILGLDKDDYLIPGEGTYECNGMQAVAYARIRKVGNADYQRTERQREVLMKLLDKVKTMSLEDIDRLANELLPMLTHNIPESEFWGLLAKAPELLGYTITQDRIPYDGLFQSVNGNLVPQWDETIRKLKITLYGVDMVDGEGNLITPTPTEEPAVLEAEETPEGEALENSSGEGAETADTEGTAASEEPLAESVEPQGVLEAQTDSDDGETSQTLREEQAQVILDSLQPEKKAAVVADNVPSEDTADTAGETEETQEKQEGITNPYVSDVFILHVPDAPQASGEGLINGSYEWELPRYTGEIIKTE